MAGACESHEAAATKKSPCPEAIAAAEHAVRQVFAIVGVNVDDPAKVEQFREELRFGRSVKRITERGFMAVIIAIATIGAATILSKLGFIGLVKP